MHFLTALQKNVPRTMIEYIYETDEIEAICCMLFVIKKWVHDKNICDVTSRKFVYNLHKIDIFSCQLLICS